MDEFSDGGTVSVTLPSLFKLLLCYRITLTLLEPVICFYYIFSKTFVIYISTLIVPVIDLSFTNSKFHLAKTLFNFLITNNISFKTCKYM